MSAAVLAQVVPVHAATLRGVRRQAAGAADSSASAAAVLGGLAYGVTDDAASGSAGQLAPASDLGGLAPVPARPLLAAQAQQDLWETAADVQHGEQASVRWRCDGHWLFGAVDLHDTDTDLATLARRAYADIFATLRDLGCNQVQRVWNYLPHIHDTSAGLERYRHFNAGRQQAFLDAGRDAFEGAPAACALGIAGDHLRIRFLAGRVPSLPVENPRQVPAYRYPQAYGPRPPTFSRAAWSPVGGQQHTLFISGTASIVGHQSLHPGDVRAQTRETVANLRAVLGAAQACRPQPGAALDLADLALVAYVRRPVDAAAVHDELQRALGPDARALRNLVMLQAEVCREELLVEIEGALWPSN
jgi:chorismate lyase / 3-hydroxybenzoate synthase